MSSGSKPAIRLSAKDPDVLAVAMGSTGRSEALGRLIRRCGVSLRELGESVGVTHSAVSQWKTGKRWPTDETMCRILETLGLPAADTLALVTASKVVALEDAVRVATDRARDLTDLHEIETVLFETTWIEVLKAQILRTDRDSRSAAFIAERIDRHQEEERRRVRESVRNVNPASKQWNVGAGVTGPSRAGADPPPEAPPQDVVDEASIIAEAGGDSQVSPDK